MSEAITIGTACTRLKWAVLNEPFTDEYITTLPEKINTDLYTAAATWPAAQGRLLFFRKDLKELERRKGLKRWGWTGRTRSAPAAASCTAAGW